MTTIDALTEVARYWRLEPRAHFELRTSGNGVDAGRDYHDTELPDPLSVRAQRRRRARGTEVSAAGGLVQTCAGPRARWILRWRVEEALLVAG